jgi:glycosyltransferase involved in cell wall biosynthesis
MPAKAVTVIHTVASLIRNSGVTPVILDYMQQRAQAGLSSRCVYFAQNGETRALRQHLSPEVQAELIPVSQPTSAWAQYAAFSRALSDAIQELQSKGQTVVVHDHGLWLPSNLAAANVAKHLGCIHVISPHGMLQPKAMTQTSIKKRLAWALYEKRRLLGAAALHVTSDIEAEAVARLLPGMRLLKVPLGIAVPTNLPAVNTRRQNVIYLGRLHPLKGIDMLLEAWQAAKQPGWTLLLVGPCDEPYRQQLQEKIAKLMIDGSVSFTGPLYDAAKEAVLQDGAVLVLPSFTENFGMVVAEALAHALPVITTIATPWDGIVDHACGWVVAPEAAALTEALRSAIHTPMNKLEQMGERGRAWMKTSFDLRELTNRMNEHYLELIGD